MDNSPMNTLPAPPVHPNGEFAPLAHDHFSADHQAAKTHTLQEAFG